MVLLLSRKKEVNGKEYAVNSYVCDFCRHKFSYEVRKSSKVQKQSSSTMVKCPHCYNFIKTWS
jgi:hypothetical protein